MLPSTPKRRSSIVLLLSTATALVILLLLVLTPSLPKSSLSYLLPTLGPARRPEYITYIPFTFGWNMLLQTLRGYQRTGWRNIVIVDNSWQGYAFQERHLLADEYGVMAVVETPVRLRFSQLMAYLDRLGQESGADAYFWSHTDVLLVPHVPNATLSTKRKSPYDLATECVRRATGDQSLAVMFFDYDRLSAVTSLAGRAAPWDPAMPQYGSDCDRYRRLRLAGLEVRDCDATIGQVVHLHSMLTVDEFELLYDERLDEDERVEMIRKADGERKLYAWRGAGEDGEPVRMGEVDRMAGEAEGSGGERYHVAKWGEALTCELEGRTPKFDVTNRL